MNIYFTFKDLQYIVAVDEYRHFAKAAETCFVTQSTLSTQIKKLEDQLGIKLFERNKKSVIPTNAGKEIIAEAKHLLKGASKILDTAKHQRQPYTFPIKLGIIPTLSPYLLPLLIPVLHKEHPELKLLIKESLTAQLLDYLAQGDLDALLLALPIIGEDYEVKPLFQEEFLVASSLEHHWVETKTIITQQDLQEENLLLLEEGHCFREQALAACQQEEIEETFWATSLETLRYMVAMNLGITLLPWLATQNTNYLIKLYTFTPPVPSRTIALIWRKEYPRAETLQYIKEAIYQCLPESIKKL